MQLSSGWPCYIFVWLILAVPSSITASSTVFSYLHPSPSQVVPHVVHLVQSLRTDGLHTSKAFLLQFTELIHCMMYQYSGFPDLYDHILEAIKVKEHTLNVLINIYSRKLSPPTSEGHFFTLHKKIKSFKTLLVSVLSVQPFQFVFSGSPKTWRRQDQAGVESKCLDVPIQLICLGSSEASWEVWDW